MSEEDVGGSKNSVGGCSSRQFDASSSRPRLGSNSPSLDGPAPSWVANIRLLGEKSIMARDCPSRPGWKINFGLN